MKIWLRRALAMALMLAIVLLVLEGVARVIDPLGVSYYPQTATYLDTLIHEEPIGYRNAPGLEGRYWGADVRINSLGMRDREVPAVPAAGEFRILFLGDSFPFGIGVAYEDSIPHQLERLLDDWNERVGFRTLNMGVPSYNTEQERIQLESLGLGLEPDLVLLFFSVNDIEPKMWVFEKRERWYVNLAQRSYALSTLALIYRQVRRVVGAPVGIGIGAFERSNPRWLAIDSSLTEINRLSEGAGARFVLFASLYPAQRPILDLLEAVGRREGFPVVNVVPEEDPVKWRNSASDGHPNARGSGLFAKLIRDGLASEKLLPDLAQAARLDGKED